MEFNASDALAFCTQTLKNREANRKTGITYVLKYYKNGYEASKNNLSGTLTGSTIAELYREFAKKYGYYKIAFIFAKSDPSKTLRFYNEANKARHGASSRKISNGWKTMTEKKRKNK